MNNYPYKHKRMTCDERQGESRMRENFTYGLVDEVSPVSCKLLRRRGFTLIELMAVISIIIILISILLPALNKAKGVAQRIQCANKLKQISTQIFMYSDDFKGSVPPYGSSVYRIDGMWNECAWYNYIKHYYFNDSKIDTLEKPSINFTCPCDKTPVIWKGTTNSYGFNFYIMPETSLRPDAFLFSGLSNPSQTYMLSDAKVINDGCAIPNLIIFRHSGKINMTYADGHTSSLKEIPATVSRNIPWCKK